MVASNDTGHTLVLSGNSWNMEGSIEALTKAARSQTSKHTKIHLKEFELDTSMAATMVNIIQKGRRDIKDLAFEECTGHVAIVVTVALTLTTALDCLSISLGNLATAAFTPIAHSLGVGLQTKNSSIRTLQLKSGSNVYFTLSADAGKSLEQGMIGNMTLERFHMEGCRFAENSAVLAISRGLRQLRTLKDARFSSCFAHNGHPLDDDSVAHLVRSLEHNSQLESLNLSRNKCLQRGISALATLLDCTNIKHVDLSCQCMSQDESMDLSLLVGALGRTSSLESLELQFNKLSSDHDMAFIAAALTHNTSIRYIGLANNKITNSGMDILCSRIPMMNTLESIDLSNNSFDEEGAEKLATAMKENFTISKIRCNPNFPSYRAIRYFTDLNWGGRRFITKNAHDAFPVISPSHWPLVLARVKNLPQDQDISAQERQAEVLYLLLRQGPAMFPV